MSAPDRRALLAPGHPALSIRRQCRLFGLARSAVYRPARIANDDELAIMRRLDELFLRWPFFGSRRMTAMLRAEGWRINRKRVRRLMGVMGLRALVRRHAGLVVSQFEILAIRWAQSQKPSRTLLLLIASRSAMMMLRNCPRFSEGVAAMRRIGLAAVSLLAVAIAGGAMAQTATPPTSVLEEMTAEIPKVDEHEARMVVAEIAPGEATAWHTHPSPVLAYVLEGTITLEQDRHGPMEYAAGQAFMEAANHKVRALNNGNGPVKILAIQLADPSAPFTVPAQ